MAFCVRVQSIEEGSIAQDCGIEPGDRIGRINGQEFSDILDYRFLLADEFLEVEVYKADGTEEILEIEKDFQDDLGIVFEKDLIDDIQSCRNKCVFCFIDQLPKGMRETLYFKDDDARMSFLLGNYITMTNLSEQDIDRIIRLHISPVNISIHATDPELRSFMLHNKFAGKLLSVMRRFYEAGIEMNGQIVACPGINDGPQLDRTLKDLEGFFPVLESVSVVPVGVTKYREELYPLEIYTKEAAGAMIRQVEEHQSRFLQEYGKRFVYLSDEFYLMAGIPLPDYDAYEGFPQIENGVGLIASLREEVACYLDEKAEKVRAANPVQKTIACGTLVRDTLEEIVDAIRKVNPALDIRVVAIENRFFGKTVTVSGLICGCDLIEQLQGRELGSEVLISSAMVKADEDVFLDDISLEETATKLGVRVKTVENDGVDLIESIIAVRQGS